MKPSPQAYRNVENIHRAGLAANRPLADDVLKGTLYFSTDTGVLERSNGTIWEVYSSGGGGSAPIVSEGMILGRGSNSGDGPAEELNPGEYIAVAGDVVDLVGAGLTPFIVQNLTLARADVAAHGKIPTDYLPNAQEMSLLPSGYVKNTTTTGVLSTVPTIPASDVIGLPVIPPNIAFKDQSNIFIQNQILQKSVPVLTFYDTSQPANLRVFHVYGGSQRMAFNATNDDNTGAVEVLNFTRLGDAIILRDIYEKRRVVPLGHWTDEPYNAANYSATASLTFIVSSGQVTYHRYAVVGKTLHWKLSLNAAVIGGSGTGSLYIQLPGGYIAAQNTNNMGTLCATPSWGTPVYAASVMGNSWITLFPVPAFSFAPGTLYLDLDIRVEIQ